MRKLLCICLLPLTLFGLDLEPWFSSSFEIQPELRYRYQGFSDVEGRNEKFGYHSRDSFATGHLGVSLFDAVDIQAEVTGAQTKAHNFNFDNACLMMRYLVLDDVMGDFCSLTVGLTGIQAMKQSLHDISSFHHGIVEGELHTAIGKEWVCGNTWGGRIWALGAVGSADVGSPWVRGNVALDLQHPSRQVWIRGFMDTLWGLGSRNITHVHDFKGYGPINHQSIDLGLKLGYQFLYCGSLSIQYARRVFATNFPRQTNNITISYLYPFGL